jgi:hypothetical protein
LAAADLTGIPGDELLALAERLEAHRRRLASLDHAVVAQLERCHVAFDVGAHDTATLLAHRLRISHRAAKRRVLDARDLGPRVDVAGVPMPPIFPTLAAAQAAGEVSDEHVAVVITTIDKLPAACQSEALEAELATHAMRETPDQLRTRVRDLKHCLDPHDSRQRAADHDRRRDLTLHRHADGSAELSGHLTPEAGIKWQTILSALSAPQPTADGTPDQRTAGQRRHDGFLTVAERILHSDTLPDCGGTPVTLIIHSTPEQITQHDGLATTEHGARIDPELMLRLTDEADTYLTFTDITGQLHLGRNSRLARPALRRALAARDGGCTFPDCEAPASWCQAHHIKAWQSGGATDINNLTLVCGYHHREHERQGWTCQIKDNVAWWTPPRKVDPEQRPRRNTRLHRKNYDFAAPNAAAPTSAAA